MTSKRERELARAKYERQSTKRAKKAVRKSNSKLIGGLAAVLALLVVVYLKPFASSTPEAVPSASAPAPLTSAAAPVAKGCDTATPLRADNMTFGQPGTASATKSLDLTTNCGSISIALDPAAPKTVNNMAFLAESKFFDGVKCHRLTTDGIFVLQCGDPTGSGSGGPGFKFDDENLPKADTTGSYTYPRGTVAMANAGANTNGSQFFLVYKDSPLPPNYSVWGKITSGLDVIDNIAAAGVTGGGNDGAPAQEVVISQAITKP